ncbi:hypothetical protein A5821_001696 [Enterococcus sp. 7F3_DIV0205]|uniref:Uncharacterized protein n=1 Tax=Candidatus Enterococcus palustris TaxID=1834189 RepID=A0AAQ3W8B0_9ENTE|nr:hypothetical protein [Enterococcus sp. 7F3_DIV0205]OTN86091.1 hypothetical protein A5821_002041 [Enterococcus sp. 7F3_DIV0205]
MEKPEVLQCNIGVCLYNPALAALSVKLGAAALIAACGGLASAIG